MKNVNAIKNISIILLLGVSLFLGVSLYQSNINVKTLKNNIITANNEKITKAKAPTIIYRDSLNTISILDAYKDLNKVLWNLIYNPHITNYQNNITTDKPTRESINQDMVKLSQYTASVEK